MESEMWKIALEKLEDATSDIDTRWIKRQRKINTKKLMTCVINSLHRKVSLKCCLCTIGGCNFTFAAYQKALMRCPVEVFRQLYNQLTQSNKSRRNRILAVDGSKIRMSKSQDTYTLCGRTHSFPMGLLSCIYDVSDKSIVTMDFNEHYDERSALERMLTYVKAGDTLVLDRGYFSEKIAHMLSSQGIKFVFRVKDKAGTRFTNIGTNVYRSKLGTPIAHTDYVVDTGNRFKLFHSVSIAHNRAKTIYRQRWDVEELFKTLKQTIRINAALLRKDAKLAFTKQLWICACLHHLIEMVSKDSTKRLKRPVNKVHIVCWLICKLSDGNLMEFKPQVVYSTSNRQRKKPG